MKTQTWRGVGGERDKASKSQQGKWTDVWTLFASFWHVLSLSLLSQMGFDWQVHIAETRASFVSSKLETSDKISMSLKDKNRRLGLLKVEKSVCFPVSFPLGVSSHSTITFFSITCAWWLFDAPPGNERRPMKVPPGCTTPVLVVGSGGRMKTTHCAPPNSFLSHSQVAIVARAERPSVSITWRRRLGCDELHCGCDWRWICYLCITTYVESSLTLGPSF